MSANTRYINIFQGYVYPLFVTFLPFGLNYTIVFDALPLRDTLNDRAFLIGIPFFIATLILTFGKARLYVNRPSKLLRRSTCNMVYVAIFFTIAYAFAEAVDKYGLEYKKLFGLYDNFQVIIYVSFYIASANAILYGIFFLGSLKK